MTTEPRLPQAASPPVSVAPMCRADLPHVVEIEAAVSSRPWSDATFLTELGRDDRRYLVARSASGGVMGRQAGTPGDTDAGRHAEDVPLGGWRGRVVGFAGVALFPDEAHVMAVAVAPAEQGRGIGARLVMGMLDVVAHAGIDAATLEVRAANVAAQRLYRRAGFTASGVRPAYYPDGEDAVIMWRHRGREVS